MEPIDNADITKVYIKEGTPHCKEHGAMNRISEAGHWRCLSAYEGSPTGHEGNKFIDRSCDAGCMIKQLEE